MVYTVMGKRISPRLNGKKGTRHIIQLSNNVAGDEGWESTIIVSATIFEELNFGDCIEINFFRVSGVPAKPANA